MINHCCQKCGYDNGEKPPVSPPWYYGKCDICKIAQHITDAWRFGIKEKDESNDD